MKNNVVHLNKISKIYKLYTSPTDRLKEAFDPRRKKYHQDFFALRNISLNIQKGRTVGIIGQNGAGKSTLLKILTGVLTPSSGDYDVNGKVSSLLELGAGFNPDLTGIENVYFNGAMFGFSTQEIDQKLDDILTFADIGEFVHQKVKTYSSGMFVRLAFAVAVQVDPDILIVDEALSVGDMRFQQKCFRRMKAFKDSGKTVIFVTHDQGTVTNFCDYVYWLKDGVVHDQGKPADVVKKYISFMAYGMDTVETEQPRTPEIREKTLRKKKETGVPAFSTTAIKWEDVHHCASFGDKGASITAIAFLNPKSQEKVTRLKGGEAVAFCMKITAHQTLEKVGVGINVNDHLGNTVFAIPSYVYDYVFPELKKGDVVLCKIRFDFPKIKNGKYSLSAAIAEGSQTNHVQHHWVHDVCFVNVTNTDLKFSLGTVVVSDSRFEVSFDSD